ARPAASPDLEAEALRPAVLGKEFALIGKRQRYRLRAVAEFEPVVEPPHRLLRTVPDHEGPVTSEFLAGGACYRVPIGSGCFADADVVVSLEARQADDVKPGRQPLDEFQLAEQGGELVGGFLPDQTAGVLNDPAGLRVAAVHAEITQEPTAK